VTKCKFKKLDDALSDTVIMKYLSQMPSSQKSKSFLVYVELLLLMNTLLISLKVEYGSLISNAYYVYLESKNETRNFSD